MADVIEEVVETAEPVVDTTVVEKTADTAASEETLLSTAGKESKKEESKTEAESPEQKTAREASEAAVLAENKRLLEADDKTLSKEELAKKQELIKADADAKANTVPDKYEVKVEGFDIDDKALETLSPLFKDMKLTNSQVQKLAEAYAPIIKGQVEAQQQAAIAMWNKQGEDWKAESVKMLGANAKVDMAFAAKFMDRFGGNTVELEGGKKTNELRVLMEETKIGNNPVMLRAIIAAGKLLGEDKFVEGSQEVTGGDVSLYDHPTSKQTLKYK